MKCEARVPRAPGAHDDKPNLNAHRCTKTASHEIELTWHGTVTAQVCGTHRRQWERSGWLALWEQA